MSHSPSDEQNPYLPVFHGPSDQDRDYSTWVKSVPSDHELLESFQQHKTFSIEHAKMKTHKETTRSFYRNTIGTDSKRFGQVFQCITKDDPSRRDSFGRVFSSSARQKEVRFRIKFSNHLDVSVQAKIREDIDHLISTREDTLPALKVSEDMDHAKFYQAANQLVPRVQLSFLDPSDPSVEQCVGYKRGRPCKVTYNWPHPPESTSPVNKYYRLSLQPGSDILEYLAEIETDEEPYIVDSLVDTASGAIKTLRERTPDPNQDLADMLDRLESQMGQEDWKKNFKHEVGLDYKLMLNVKKYLGLSGIYDPKELQFIASLGDTKGTDSPQSVLLDYADATGRPIKETWFPGRPSTLNHVFQ